MRWNGWKSVRREELQSSSFLMKWMTFKWGLVMICIMFLDVWFRTWYLGNSNTSSLYQYISVLKKDKFLIIFLLIENAFPWVKFFNLPLSELHYTMFSYLLIIFFTISNIVLSFCKLWKYKTLLFSCQIRLAIHFKSITLTT